MIDLHPVDEVDQLDVGAETVDVPQPNPAVGIDVERDICEPSTEVHDG